VEVINTLWLDTPVTPKKLKFTVPPSSTDPAQTSIADRYLFATCAEAALYWHKFGFSIIPIVPHSKLPALSWDPWLNKLSPAKIAQHWSGCPGHEIGFIVGDDLIVFDADSPESIAAMVAIEEEYNVTPKMVVKTTKGEHHYFKRANGTFAKSDSHSTKEYPDRLDVKTGRSMVILPPSTGKSLVVDEAENASELTEVGQDYIDAVFQHNGRTPPRLAEVIPSSGNTVESHGPNLGKLNALLEHVDPDSGGYQNWLNGLMAIYHETGGREDGFEIAVAWSEKGKNYKGEKEIRVKWDSFKSGSANPITIATLIKMAKDSGADLSSIYASAGDEFEICETEKIYPGQKSPDVPVKVEATSKAAPDERKVTSNPFDKYSLRGRSDEIEKWAVDDVHVLGQLALQAQLTALYSPPNTGKTLITQNLLIESIKLGRIDSSKVYYLNMDDNSNGLLVKARIADEYEFHMLAEGYLDFSANQFHGYIKEMTENDQAHGAIIILDTLKKFVNLMDKTKCSNFTRVLRGFALKGGTVIALAHTNKNPGQDGKLKYGGVSDILNDFDCAYTMRSLASQAENGERVVEFENIKRRGNVVEHAAYSYSIGNGIPYNEILLSVRPFDEDQLEPLKQAETAKSDAVVIGVVTACIKDGVKTKMKLAEAAAKRAGISKRSALQIIEKYTGDDPVAHRWNFAVVERGAKDFVLLDSAASVPSLEKLKT